MNEENIIVLKEEENVRIEKKNKSLYETSNQIANSRSNSLVPKKRLIDEIDKEILTSMIELSNNEDERNKILSSFNLVKNYENSKLPPIINSKQVELELFMKQVREIYLNHNKKYFFNEIQNASLLAKLNKSKNLEGHDAMIKDVWFGFIGRTQWAIRNMIELVKQLPIYKEMKTSQDLQLIIKHNHAYYIMVFHLHCFTLNMKCPKYNIFYFRFPSPKCIFRANVTLIYQII